MAVSTFIKTSGMAALAASMALAALPSAASAQERGGRRGDNAEAAPQSSAPEGRRAWGGGEGRSNGGSAGWQGRQQGQAQAQARAQVQAPPQVQVAPQVQARVQEQRRPSWEGRNGAGSSWGARAGGNSNGDWSGGARGSWQQRTEATPPPVSQQPTRNWNGGDRREGSGWSGQRDRREWSGRSVQTPAPSWQGNPRNWTSNDRRSNDWRRDDDRHDNTRWTNNRNERWDRDWRQDNRYNWSGWRNSHRDVFSLGAYYSPYRNWSYRRLSAGFYLDSLFFSSNYWINDPWQYRLPDAYGPYRWVRYYDDALLVDIYSGEVVDVIYSFFW